MTKSTKFVDNEGEGLVIIKNGVKTKVGKSDPMKELAQAVRANEVDLAITTAQGKTVAPNAGTVQNQPAPVKPKKPVTVGKNGKVNNWGKWDQGRPATGPRVTTGVQQTGAVAGYDGPAMSQDTIAAIRQFQTDNGLAVTGNLDPDTVNFAASNPQRVAAAVAAKKAAGIAKVAANKAAAAQTKQANAAKSAASKAAATAKAQTVSQNQAARNIAKAQITVIQLHLKQTQNTPNPSKTDIDNLKNQLAAAQAAYSNMP